MDVVYLQQDAFDPVDVRCALSRQKEAFDLLVWMISQNYSFATDETARRFFTSLTDACKNLSYSRESSVSDQEYRNTIVNVTRDFCT